MILLFLFIYQKVSGTYQSGINAAKNIKVKNIKVLDSLSASVGLGLLAIHAVDLNKMGHHTIKL